MLLPNALSTQKLDALRSHKHSTQLYLSIYQPNVIFNGVVNNAVVRRGVRTIPYGNSVSGTWAQIESGMTLWVGSSSGTFDKGKVRVKSATSTELEVAENEYIQWTSGTYLTVVNYVDLVAIFPRLVQDTGDETVVNFYKDYDIAYTNQNEVLGAFPVMGSHRAGFLDENGKLDLYWSATGTYPMVSGSYVQYNWSFPGAIATGTAGQTPGIARYTGTGNYVVKLQLTVSGSVNATETAYRYVSVYDKPNRGTVNPIRTWKLSDLAGSRDDGGFRGKIEVFEALNYKLVGGELVVIFSEDEFNGVPQSIDIGTVSPDDNILFVGYILDDTVEYDYEKSKVSFDIGSPSEVLKKTENFAISVESMSNPSQWWHFYDMTTKKAMYHYIKWHSTLMKVADVFWLGKDYYVQFFDSERTNMWDAIQAFMRPTLIGNAICNNKGQVVFQTEPESFQVPTAAYPTIMTLDDRDISNNVDVQDNMYGEASYLEMGGIAYDGALNSNTSVPLLSAAPGTAPRYYGKNQSNQGLALLDQDNLNEITGNMYAKANANPSSFRATMAGNYRYTLAPLNLSLIYVPESRTFQRKMISGTYFASNINYNYDAEDSYLSSSVEFEQVVDGIPGATLQIKPPNELAPLVFPPLVFPGLGGFGTNVKYVVLLTESRGIWFTDNFDSDYPFWYAGGISYYSYSDGKAGETPAIDGATTLRTLDITSSGIVVVCGTYALYAGEIGFLAPFATSENLIDEIGDYDPTVQKVHPQFFVCGIDGGGSVVALAGHPYGSQPGSGGADSFIWAGSIGGIAKGDSLGTNEAESTGSATRSGGSWFITYGEQPAGNDNIWLNSPNGINIASKGSALNGRTVFAQGCFHTQVPGTGVKYFHAKRDGAGATVVMTRTDENDNESDVIDAGDTSEPSLRRAQVAISPAGAIMRAGGGDNGFRLTRDSGSTWTGITGSGVWNGQSKNGAVCHAGDENSWIIAVNQLSVECGVYFTPDDGANWLDKTGNLRNYFTTDFIVKDMKAFL